MNHFDETKTFFGKVESDIIIFDTRCKRFLNILFPLALTSFACCLGIRGKRNWEKVRKFKNPREFPNFPIFRHVEKMKGIGKLGNLQEATRLQAKFDNILQGLGKCGSLYYCTSKTTFCCSLFVLYHLKLKI